MISKHKCSKCKYATLVNGHEFPKMECYLEVLFLSSENYTPECVVHTTCIYILNTCGNILQNGFKCHMMSESHQRQLLLFAENPDKYIDDFSKYV